MDSTSESTGIAHDGNCRTTAGRREKRRMAAQRVSAGMEEERSEERKSCTERRNGGGDGFVWPRMNAKRASTNSRKAVCSGIWT